MNIDEMKNRKEEDIMIFYNNHNEKRPNRGGGSKEQKEPKTKNDKAIKNIMEEQKRFHPRFGISSSFVNTSADANTFYAHLEIYGRDITENEDAAMILKQLRSYENATKRELEKIQKLIRDGEDRFPSIV
jgi:hypothetical protein